MQISETVKRFITDKVTEIYKTKFEAIASNKNQDIQAEIDRKVDEIITILELNGGGIKTLTQLLHDAAMPL